MYNYATSLPNVKNKYKLGDILGYDTFDLYSKFPTATDAELEKCDWIKSDVDDFGYYSYSLYEVDGDFWGKSQLNNYDSIESYFNISNSISSIYLGIQGNLNKWPHINSDFSFNSKSYTLNILEQYSNTDIYNYMGYPFPQIAEDLTQDALDRMVSAIGNYLTGDLGYVFEIDDDIFYAVTFSGDEPCGGALFRLTSTGFDLITADDTPATPEIIGAAAQILKSQPNISIDYVSAGEDKRTYLTNILNSNIKPNDLAKTEIALYIENAVENESVTDITANGNSIIIDEKSLTNSIDKAQKSKTDYEQILGDITLNKTVPVNLKLNANSMDIKKPMHITFNSKVDADAVGDVVVVLNEDSQHKISIHSADLNSLIEKYGALTVQIKKTSSDTYALSFSDANGNDIVKLNTSVSVSIPANSSTATIMATYSEGAGNWGGQYDSYNQTLTFETPYAGEYQVLSQSININDIDGYSDKTKQAIEFLVSKGYFSLDENNNFMPDDTLTRYDFSEALVGMFFALDPSLVTSFTDVAKDSPYYHYVASGEHDSIITGYEDQTFRGDNTVIREEVIAFCGRTLADKKGYSYPENPEDYLLYSDRAQISDWAIQTTALSSREQLISNTGILNPQGEISRADAAEILYRLFMLLYETPITSEIRRVEKSPVILLVGGGTSLTIAGVLLIYSYKKGKSEE